MTEISFYLRSLWKARALAGVLLCCLTLLVALPTTGCTQQQKVAVAQEIVNWTPSVVSAADTVGATVALLQPQYAVIVASATAGFDLLAKGLQVAANDYLANPSQTTLALLQTEIMRFQQSVNTSMLQVAQIKDANSQRMAMAAINALATVVNTILGLVQSISTKTQLAAMSKQAHLTLADVRVHMDEAALYRASQKVTTDMGWPISYAPTPDQFFAHEAQTGF